MPRNPVPRQRFTMKKNPMKMLIVLGGFFPFLMSPSHHGQLKRRHFIFLTANLPLAGVIRKSILASFLGLLMSCIRPANCLFAAQIAHAE